MTVRFFLTPARCCPDRPGVPRLRYAEVTALGGDPGLSAPANPTGPGSTAGQSHATCIRIR
jgi:hypothetical protein